MMQLSSQREELSADGFVMALSKSARFGILAVRNARVSKLKWRTVSAIYAVFAALLATRSARFACPCSLKPQ